MGKENFDAYSVGRFEASNFTRNALMGNREGNNIRSQQLGTPKDAFKQVETFTPKQLKAKEAITGLQHGQEYKNAKNAQDLQDSINFINLSNRKAFQEDMLMRMEPQIWAAIDRRLGEEGKKQVLAAAKAREASVEKTVIANQEQAVVVKQQVEAETAKVLAQAPEALLYGSLAVLAVWVIKHLPSRFFKVATTMTVISVILGGCMAVNAATNTPEVPNPNKPTSTEVANLPDETEEAQPTITATRPVATATARPTETAQVNQADQLLASYLAGEAVDTSVLSPAEFAEFSSDLAEKRNVERGVSVVVFDSGDGNPAYIDQNLDMRPYDGSPDQSEVIDMFLPVAGYDDEGNIQVEQNGELITIANSAGIDWDAVITDPNDPRINWPIGDAGEALRWQLTESPNLMIIRPAFLLSDNVHNFFVENHGFMDGMQILTVEETDSNGLPILIRVSISIPGSIYELMEQGKDVDYLQKRKNPDGDGDAFYAHLQENSLYYIGFYTDIQTVYTKYMSGGSINNYSGIVPVNETASVLTNKTINNEDLLIIPIAMFIK